MAELPAFPIEARMAAAEEYLKARLALPWEELTSLYGQDLPTVRSKFRLLELGQFAGDHLDLRAMRGGGELRQAVDYNSGDWSEFLGLSGIDDAESEISVKMLEAHRKIGLVDATPLPPNYEPDAVVTFGAFGVSALHRIQVLHGLQPTRLDEHGNYQPEAIPDKTAHPALASPHTLRISVSSMRALSDSQGEPQEVAPFAPDATTEADLAENATLLAMGSPDDIKCLGLPDVGYAYEGRAGFMLVQKAGGRLAINVCMPKPDASKRGRAQAPHAFSALQHALYMLPTLGRRRLSEGSTIAIVVNASNAYLQTVAMRSMLRTGLRPTLTTFSAQQTGLPRALNQPQLRLLPEVLAEVKHLQRLNREIDALKYPQQ